MPGILIHDNIQGRYSIGTSNLPLPNRSRFHPLQIFMVAIWNGFKTVTDKETAWRVSFIVPAVIVLLVAIGQLFLSDDCPKGNYKELEAHGAMERKPSGESAKIVSSLFFSLKGGIMLGRLPSLELRLRNGRKTSDRVTFFVSPHNGGLRYL